VRSDVAHAERERLFCWICNARLRGYSDRVVIVEGLYFAVHASCAKNEHLTPAARRSRDGKTWMYLAATARPKEER
jgi:hypothetical protein